MTNLKQSIMSIYYICLLFLQLGISVHKMGYALDISTSLSRLCVHFHDCSESKFTSITIEMKLFLG